MASNYDSTTDQVLSIASNAVTQAGNQAARIQSLPRPVLKETGLNYTAPNFTLDAPPSFGDLFSNAGNAPGNVSTIAGDAEKWINQFFPNLTGKYSDVPEEFLVAIISGTRPFGIDATVFELVWHQARDRANRTVLSERRTLEASFSSSGFTLPPGALVDAVLQSQARGTAAVLDVSRDQAMKDAEIKQDLLKFAAQTMATLKLGVMQAAADYFRAVTSLYQLDSDTARIKAQAYSAFYNALAAYYGVEVSLEELKLRGAEGKAGTDSAIDRNRLSAFDISNGNQALGQATRAFGDIASNAVNAAGTLVAQIESVST